MDSFTKAEGQEQLPAETPHTPALHTSRDHCSLEQCSCSLHAWQDNDDGLESPVDSSPISTCQPGRSLGNPETQQSLPTQKA